MQSLEDDQNSMVTLQPKLEVLQLKLENLDSEDDFVKAVSDNIPLFKSIFKVLKTAAPEDLLYDIVEKFTDMLMVLSDAGQRAKLCVISGVMTNVLDLVMDQHTLFLCRLMVLKCFNTVLEGLSIKDKEGMFAENSLMDTVKSLYLSIFSAGDYELQVCTIECIFRLMPRKLLKTAFQECPWGEQFKFISGGNFEVDCRNFLNQVNMCNKDSTLRLCAVEADYVKLDGEKVHKPSDQGYNEFWIDFNPGSKRISIFCEQTLLSSQPTQADDQMWETISVWVKDIKRFDVTAQSSDHKVTIELNPGARLLSNKVVDSQPHLIVICAHKDFNLPTLIEDICKTTRKASGAIKPVTIIKKKDCPPAPPPVRRKASLPSEQMKSPAHSVISVSSSSAMENRNYQVQSPSTQENSSSDNTKSTEVKENQGKSERQGENKQLNALPKQSDTNESLRGEPSEEQIDKSLRSQTNSTSSQEMISSVPIKNESKTRQSNKTTDSKIQLDKQIEDDITQKSELPLKTRQKAKSSDPIDQFDESIKTVNNKKQMDSTKSSDQKKQVEDQRNDRNRGSQASSEASLIVQEGGDNNLSLRRSQRGSQKHQTEAKPKTLGDVIECSLEPGKMSYNLQSAAKIGKQKKKAKNGIKEKAADNDLPENPNIRDSSSAPISSPKKALNEGQVKLIEKTPPTRHLRSRKKAKTPVVTVEPAIKKGTNIAQDEDQNKTDQVQEPTISSLYEEQQSEKQEKSKAKKDSQTSSLTSKMTLKEMWDSHQKQVSPGTMSVEEFKPEKFKRRDDSSKKASQKKNGIQKMKQSKNKKTKGAASLHVDEIQEKGEKTDSSDFGGNNDSENRKKKTTSYSGNDGPSRKNIDSSNAYGNEQDTKKKKQATSKSSSEDQPIVTLRDLIPSTGDKATPKDLPAQKEAKKQRENHVENVPKMQDIGKLQQESAASTNDDYSGNADENTTLSSYELYIESDRETGVETNEIVAETQYDASPPCQDIDDYGYGALACRSEEEMFPMKNFSSESLKVNEPQSRIGKLNSPSGSNTEKTKSNKKILNPSGSNDILSSNSGKINVSNNVQNSYVFGNIVSKKRTKQNLAQKTTGTYQVKNQVHSEKAGKRMNKVLSGRAAEDTENHLGSKQSDKTSAYQILEQQHTQTTSYRKEKETSRINPQKVLEKHDSVKARQEMRASYTEEASPQVSSSTDKCVDKIETPAGPEKKGVKDKEPQIKFKPEKEINQSSSAPKRALRFRTKPISYKEPESLEGSSISDFQDNKSKEKQKLTTSKSKTMERLGRSLDEEQCDYYNVKTPIHQRAGNSQMSQSADRLGIYAPKKLYRHSSTSRISMLHIHQQETTVLTSYGSQNSGSDPYDFEADCEIRPISSKSNQLSTPSPVSSQERKTEKSRNPKKNNHRRESLLTKCKDKDSVSPQQNVSSYRLTTNRESLRSSDHASGLSPIRAKDREFSQERGFTPEPIKRLKAKVISEFEDANEKRGKKRARLPTEKKKLSNQNDSEVSSSDSSHKYGLYASQVEPSKSNSGLMFPPLEDAIPCTPYQDSDNDLNDEPDEIKDRKSVCSELSWVKHARKTKTPLEVKEKKKGKTYEHSKIINAHEDDVEVEDNPLSSDQDQLDVTARDQQNSYLHTSKQTAHRQSSARRKIFSPLDFRETSKSPFSTRQSMTSRSESSLGYIGQKSPASILMNSTSKLRRSTTPKTAKSLSFKSPEDEPSSDSEDLALSNVEEEEEMPTTKEKWRKLSADLKVSRALSESPRKKPTKSASSSLSPSSRLSLVDSQMKQIFGNISGYEDEDYSLGLQDSPQTKTDSTPRKTFSPLSGPSSVKRPSHSELKRKYPYISDSDKGKSSSDENTGYATDGSKIKPRKLFTPGSSSFKMRRKTDESEKSLPEPRPVENTSNNKRQNSSAAKKRTPQSKAKATPEKSQKNLFNLLPETFLSSLTCMSPPEKARSCTERKSLSDFSAKAISSSEQLALSPTVSPQIGLSQITISTPSLDVDAPQPTETNVDLLGSVMKSLQTKGLVNTTKQSEKCFEEESEEDEVEEEPVTDALSFRSLREMLLKQQMAMRKTCVRSDHENDSPDYSPMHRPTAGLDQSRSTCAVQHFHSMIEKMLNKKDNYERQMKAAKDRMTLVWMQQIQSMKENRIEQEKELQKVKDALENIHSTVMECTAEERASQKSMRAELKQEMDKFQRKILARYNEQSLEAMKKCLQVSLMFS